MATPISPFTASDSFLNEYRTYKQEFTLICQKPVAAEMKHSNLRSTAFQQRCQRKQ